jgi:hypothetical protein
VLERHLQDGRDVLRDGRPHDHIGQVAAGRDLLGQHRRHPRPVRRRLEPLGVVEHHLPGPAPRDLGTGRLNATHESLIFSSMNWFV